MPNSPPPQDCIAYAYLYNSLKWEPSHLLSITAQNSFYVIAHPHFNAMAQNQNHIPTVSTAGVRKGRGRLTGASHTTGSYCPSHCYTSHWMLMMNMVQQHFSDYYWWTVWLWHVHWNVFVWERNREWSNKSIKDDSVCSLQCKCVLGRAVARNCGPPETISAWAPLPHSSPVFHCCVLFCESRQVLWLTY